MEAGVEDDVGDAAVVVNLQLNLSWDSQTWTSTP